MENITRQEHPQLPPVPSAQPPGTVIGPGGTVSHEQVTPPVIAPNGVPETPVIAPQTIEPKAEIHELPTVVTAKPKKTVAKTTVKKAPEPKKPKPVSKPLAPAKPPKPAKPTTDSFVKVITPTQPTDSAVANVLAPVSSTATVISPQAATAEARTISPTNTATQTAFDNGSRFHLPSVNILKFGIISAGALMVLVIGGVSYAVLSRKHNSAANTAASSTTPSSGLATTTTPGSTPTTGTSPSGTTTPTAPTNTPAPAASTPYEAAIQRFITAIQNNDKATADSMQAPAFSQALQQLSGTTSFYDACQSSGALCSNIFNASNLAAAAKASKAYVASDGTKGQEDDFTFPTNSSVGANPDGSPVVASIAVVPSGSTWLVYHIGQSGALSIN